jgi:pyruvate dehydrogenase E1 component
MAFVRLLSILVKDPNIGSRIVPIVPDEARTFGMEGMFRQLGIYSSVGQLYEPVDTGQIMSYREDRHGQVMEEGINEGGAFAAWLAAATSYSNHAETLVPFYIYYSMFGFQRIGDLCWAAGDLSARGFLLGGTSGRTTLNGEGLQHQDGHSHILAGTVPNCVTYDPAFAYELAVIVQHGLQVMFVDKQACYFYITVTNENHSQPAMPKGCEEGIRKGMYQLSTTGPKSKRSKKRVQLLGSGAILHEVLAAAELLLSEFGISVDIFSVTSFNELKREGDSVQRWNRLNPDQEPRRTHVQACLLENNGPVIAATDYIKLYADQIRSQIDSAYHVLGTDGFGRSDTRARLRRHFEVDRFSIAYTALLALADENVIDVKTVLAARTQFDLDPSSPDPVTL